MLSSLDYSGNTEKAGGKAVMVGTEAGSGVSRLTEGCLVHWLTRRGECWGVQQDFSLHTCLQLAPAVHTACFFVQLVS